MEVGIKITFHICTIPPRVQNFRYFALRLPVFEIFHILGFSIESHVKISKRYNIFKTWPIFKEKEWPEFYRGSPNVVIKFGYNHIKTIRGTTF